MKVSAFTGTSDGSDESLLMLSYSTDGGVTYQTRKIRLDDFIDDFNVEDLANVDGAATEDQILKWNGTAWVPSDPTTVLAPSLTNLQWKYQTDRSPATGNGFFSINGFTPQTANLLYVDHEIEDGRDVQNFVNSFVEEGQRLYVRQKDDDTKYFIFDVTGAPIPNATSIAIPVVDVASGTLAIDANASCLFQFITRPATDGSETTLPDDVMREGEDVSLLNNDAGYLTSVPANVMTEGENISLLNNDAGYITSATVDIPADVMREGENVSLLANDAGYVTADAAAPIAAGFTLGLSQALLAENKQLGQSVLAVPYVTTDYDQRTGATITAVESGPVQITSLDDGNALFVYANGDDYTNRVVQEGPVFLSKGEVYVILDCVPGTIITATAGCYGFAEQKNGTQVSPMPLLSIALGFNDTFFYAFRNSNGGTGSSDQGWIHIVNGPVASTVSMFDAAGVVVPDYDGNAQEDLELTPWQYKRLYTNGNGEYRIVSSQLCMAAFNARMGDKRFYDSRLIMPMTSDGITWPRSGYISGQYANTKVRYYVADGGTAAVDANGIPSFTVSPGSPIAAQGSSGTGADDSDYEANGATRFRAAGIISGFSGADSAGLEATPMAPTSTLTQRVALPLRVQVRGDGGNNGIALASPFEGKARLYQWNRATGEADPIPVRNEDDTENVFEIEIKRRFPSLPSPYTSEDQFHPASALISPSSADAPVHRLLVDFQGGYIESDVPVTVVINSEQNEAGGGVIESFFRATGDILVRGIHANDDEQLSYGITPSDIRCLTYRDSVSGLLYKLTLEDLVLRSGSAKWVRA